MLGLSLYTNGKGKRKRVKSVGLNDLGVKDDHLSLLFAAFPFFLRGVLILSLFLSKDLSEEHCNRGLKPQTHWSHMQIETLPLNLCQSCPVRCNSASLSGSLRQKKNICGVESYNLLKH